ncbi:MAG TPA: AcvB/VirJ family lysyl-phosphatidylglycerol hydrolase [Steroidobacteraceae bacterium]|jgi:type IV secretory pathway VirJ component|nr:AcvB/VirJ family lysyl-phosphatidylglycerol hydrolase [Steroidobacteraceae bacterium]
MKYLTALAAYLLLSALATAAPSHISHGRFKDLAVYPPPAQPTSFVLLLSGNEGMNARADRLARQLAQQGAMVVGIDWPEFKTVLEADGGDCEFPDGDLENLSHFVQAYFHDSSYLAPLLVGIDAGGSVAYAVLAQAPGGTFAGALSLGFCPHLQMEKPLCKGSGLELTHGGRGSGIELEPIKSLSDPWVVLQPAQGTACPAATAGGFVAQVRGGAVATLPQVPDPAIMAAFAKLVAANAKRGLAPPPAALGDLPVIEVPAHPDAAPSDEFAIIMSGDGGWAGLDRDIAAALSAKGIPVVGLDSLRYYWSARTPQGLAADTDRMIRYYLAHFGKRRVLLIGYSQGADVLPFAVNRLPAATKAHVALAAILGMSEHALFEFHVSNWLADDKSGPETLPEVNRISGMPVLCIYGQDERDSLCPKLDPHRFDIVKLKGGHHFDGNYSGLADRILSAARS